MWEDEANPWPVDSERFTLPDGQEVIGRDAYEAAMTRRALQPDLLRDYDVVAETIPDLGERILLAHRFIGALAHECGRSPQGQLAWARALEDVEPEAGRAPTDPQA